jgi:hypothetical protein
MSTWRNLFKAKEVDQSYVWTCGNDPKVSHRKPIASGGFGEVHEVGTAFPIVLNVADEDIQMFSKTKTTQRVFLVIEAVSNRSVRSLLENLFAWPAGLRMLISKTRQQSYRGYAKRGGIKTLSKSSITTG